MSLGSQIRSARKRLGLKLERVAKQADITAGALSLIERDRRRPSEGTLKLIAKALKTKIEDLVGELEGKTIDKQVEVLFARFTQASESDKHLLKRHILDLPDSAELARKLRIELNNLDGPIDPVVVANQLGISIREDSFEGFEAALVITGKKNLILVRSGLGLGRKNFVIAHEIAHFRLDGHTDSGYNCQ